MPLVLTTPDALAGGPPSGWRYVNLMDTAKPTPHPNAVRRSYTLRSQFSPGVSGQPPKLNFWFDSTAPLPNGANDGPLDLRVFDQENLIEITLADSDVDWYFRMDEGTVMVVETGTAAADPLKYYKDVVFDPQSGASCKRLWLFATQRPGGAMVVDPITFRVTLNQNVPGRGLAPLDLYIDPGIKNPGDDP
jgi:hypothetical protein